MTDGLPPAPAGSFASDNAAGASPEVMEALAAANVGPALAYGDDPWTEQATAQIRELFDAPVEVLFCWGGTGANVVGLATLLQPWQAVITAESAHIVVDECGAPARFTGATVTPVAAPDGKVEPAAVEPFLHWRGTEHHPQPAVIAISQSTELGTLYTIDETASLCDLAHANGMTVHVDGARIANAVAATGRSLGELLLEPGVDVLTFGFTKNGALYGEAVVFLRPDLARSARFVRKQAGQLPSKARYVAAQVSALLADDLWIRNATHANLMATGLAEAVRSDPAVTVTGAPAVNAVFAQVPAAAIRPLQDWSFFWEWDLDESLVRWMTSFATTAEDVERFATGVAEIVARHR